MDRIALIGISCEFSNDIHSPHSLWSFMATNAHHESEMETEQTDSPLDSVPLFGTGLNSSEESTQHRYFLKKELLDEFDRDFFGISDQEAQIIDPSDRILLEKFVHLLEDSNYTINQINGTKTAVFIEQTSDKRPLIIAEKGFDSDTAPLVSNLHNCSASIRLAYHFNLRGPNLTLDTTHPSSLVSLSMAVQALRTGEADYAVIGGTNVLQTNEQLLCDKQLQPVPSEGRNGYTKGEGVALILLKRLSDAIRDCDQIYCVIRDVVFHCNNDIVIKDFSMASHSAQLQLLNEIYITRNQIDLSEIFYIEELDGGTIDNELIKNNAIGEFFHHDEASAPLLLGTIKSNIGDIGSAAGTAALINVALSMKNRIILPQRNYGHDNTITKSEKYNVQIAHQRTMFPQNRLALIGINGKNSHAIIEEWGNFSQSHSEKEISSKCLEANNSSTLEQQQYYLAVISAKCQLSLISQLNNFSKWYSSLLLENQNHILPGLCYKLLLKRNTNFSHRASFIFSNNEEFKNQISVSLPHVDTNNINGTPGSVFCQIKQSHASQVHQNICFVYCGTGPQWWKMGRELYNSEPVFRKWIDKISKELQKLTTEWSLIEELINVQNEKSSHINETNIAQPAIFAVQVALTALWLSWGIYPRVILGHSVGEIAAAYVSGRLTLEDACIVIYHYSRLQHRNTRQGGRMLAVMGLNETEARSFLKGIEHRVSFAAINSPTSVTYSGFSTELEQLHQLLTKTKPSVFKTWIRLENALHSPLMDNFNIYQDLLTSLSSINGDYYKIHEDDRFDKVCANATLYSTVTGECKNLCFDCSYWWKNLRNTAMFSQTIQTILHERLHTTHVFLEISPHPVLVSSIQECMDYLKCDSVPLIIHSLKRKENEQQTILSSLCRLPNINWSKFLRTRSWNASSNDQTILCRLNQMPYYAFDNRKVYDYRTTTIISLQNDIKSNDQLMLSIDIEKITKDVHSMVEKLFTLSNILEVIDTDRPLMAQGLDSLTAMSLAQSLCLKYSTRIPVTTLLQGKSIKNVAEHIYSHLLNQSRNTDSITTSIHSLLEDANESQESNTTKASSDYSSKYDGFNDFSEFKNYQLVWKPLNLTEARASYAQERIWFDTKVRFNGQTAIYNELLLLKVSKSGISLNRLQRAVSKVVRKHSILRTSIKYDGNEDCLKQYITSTSDNEKQLLYSFNITFVSHEEEFREIVLNEQINASLLSLEEGILLHCHIIRCHTLDSHISQMAGCVDTLLNINDKIVFFFHHIAFDGSSIKIFLDDLCLAYESDQCLPPLPLQYIDYSEYERSIDMYNAKEYWKKTLDRWYLDDEMLHRIDLPYDFKEQLNQSRNGKGFTVQFSLDTSLVDKITNYATQKQATLFHLYLTIYYIYLFKLTGSNNRRIRITSLSANRYNLVLQSLIGMFVNTIPYYFEMDPSLSLEQQLKYVQQLCFEILPHTHFPHQQLIHLNSQKAMPSDLISNLLQTCIQVEVSHLHKRQNWFTPITSDITNIVAKCDLLLRIDYVPDQKQMTVSFTCATDLFEQETIHTMADRFHILLEQLFYSYSNFQRDKQPVYELSILLPKEVQMIKRLNDTYADVSADHPLKPIHEEFFDRASQYSQKLAVVLDEQSLTYSELLYYVQHIASYLIHERYIKPKDVICLFVDRSIEMIVGILSILAAGAVYCPLNPNDPWERISLLTHEVQPKLILYHSLTSLKFQHKNDFVSINIENSFHLGHDNDLTNQQLDTLMKIRVSTSNIAYYLFTSGSTGTPKIATFSHENFLCYIKSTLADQTNSSYDLVMQSTACSFDYHMSEIAGTLLLGCTVVAIKPNGNKDLRYFTDTIAKHNVTFVILLPSLMQLIYSYLEENQLFHKMDTIRVILTGGDVSKPSLIFSLLQNLSLNSNIINQYGPAECSIVTTNLTIYRHDINKYELAIPIGSPVKNYQCYILDNYLQFLSVGQVGELYIGSFGGMFQGYLNRPNLTEEVMKELPHIVDGQKFYRSGDLVKINKWGTIEFVGRKDFQVKLSGQRIETGEIENTIMKLSSSGSPYSPCIAAIHNCLVMKVSHESKEQDFLVAYIHAIHDDLEKRKKEIEKQIKTHCQKHLPVHMIPSFFILMKEFPLNQNGKVDRKQLPTLTRSLLINETLVFDDKHSDVVINTAIEQVLLKIFIESFDISADMANKINVDISFSALGASSLHAMKALTLIRKRLYPDMNIQLLFSNPSVRQLARVLESLVAVDTKIERVKTVTEASVLSLKNEQQFQKLEPSLVIETLSVLLLISVYILPILSLIRLHPFSVFILNITFWSVSIPSVHLIQYIVIKKLLFSFDSQRQQGEYQLFSWAYYRWWILQRLWSLNTNILSILTGTSFYNSYLRLCGAHIGQNTHLLTTSITVPDLIDVGDSVFIGKEVLLCNILYQQQTFRLDKIKIHNNCTIEARSVLYGGVDIKEKVLVKSMSSVSGLIAPNSIVDGQNIIHGESSSVNTKMNSDQFTQFKIEHKLYQFLCIIIIFLIHILSINIGSQVSTLFETSIGVVFGLIVYLFVSMCAALFLFFIIIGSLKADTTYKLNTFAYLHKIWFRSLVSNSLFHSFSILPKKYHHYLCAKIGENVEIGITIPDGFLGLPGSRNLVQIDSGVTVNCDYLLLPMEMTHEQECRINKIQISDNVFIGNMVTIHQGATIKAQTTVGSLTRITSLDNTVNNAYNPHQFYLGIPAANVPLISLTHTPAQYQASLTTKTYKYWWNKCKIMARVQLRYLLSVIVPIILCSVSFLWFSSLTYYNTMYYLLLNWLLFLSFIIYCALVCIYDEKCRYICKNDSEYTYSYNQLFSMNVYHTHVIDYFFSGTQWLIILLRIMGAKIGHNVILNDFFTITDPQLTVIDNNVRIHCTASIQAHTYEKRKIHLSPISIGSGTIIMPYVLIHRGCKLEGNNQIFPLTYLMTNDYLAMHTNWIGSPAKLRLNSKTDDNCAFSTQEHI